MAIIELIFGFLLVFAGRSLFWLCVGVAGFLVGVECSSFFAWQGWTALAGALIIGFAGAVLAVSFEWLAVVIGVGFLGGGYLLMSMFPSAAARDPYAWLIFAVGGIAGMCLMAMVFDWTLILVSCLLGASLIVHGFHGPENLRDTLFIGIVCIGLVAQYLTLRDASSEGRGANRRGRIEEFV